MTDHLFVANLLAWSMQVCILTLAAAALAALARLDAPAARHAWWRSVLVVCLLLPLLQPWRPLMLDVPPELVQLGKDVTPPTSSAAAVPGEPLLASGPFPLGSSRSWGSVIVGALAVGAVLRLAWLAAGLLRLRRLRRAGEIAVVPDLHPELQALVEAGAEVRYVDVAGQPVTFGIRRPVVLLPAGVGLLSPELQRAVLAHELWHVRRRDWIWVILEEVIRGILWFHPAIWWLISRVQATREEVVDELTVLATNSRRSYLEALLVFADQPPLVNTAAGMPLARRRHLFHRMLLISREAMMSSRRIVASCAAMSLALLMAGWFGVGAFPLYAQTAQPRSASPQAPPRDPQPSRPGPAASSSSREEELQKTIQAEPTNARAYLELTKLQEKRGARTEAEQTLLAARQALPNNSDVLGAMAGFYNRTGEFDRAVAALEEIAAMHPSDPLAHQRVGVFFWEKAFKDQTLSPTDKLTYIHQGLSAFDRALAISPDFADALIYKNLLLRLQANLESDGAKQRQLIAEADKLRNRAMELKTSQAPGSVPPPPPPPPPPSSASQIDEKVPLRIGGTIKTPTKLKDVKPIYPQEAEAARVQGVVILEAVIDETGKVRDAKVLRSIPILDQAAVDAVLQWEFTPTELNGVPHPVVMTVTVNFALQ
jgi:TonB family protein